MNFTAIYQTKLAAYLSSPHRKSATVNCENCGHIIPADREKYCDEVCAARMKKITDDNYNYRRQRELQSRQEARITMRTAEANCIQVITINGARQIIKGERRKRR